MPWPGWTLLFLPLEVFFWSLLFFEVLRRLDPIFCGPVLYIWAVRVLPLDSRLVLSVCRVAAYWVRFADLDLRGLGGLPAYCPVGLAAEGFY